MNIFWLDKKIDNCVKYHNNKHCVKMILEYAQLLCSAHWAQNKKAPYKETHLNHPCAIWVRQSKQNYNTLVKLALALCKEYTFRYGKIHKTEQVIRWAKINQPDLPSVGFTEPPQTIPDKYKHKNYIKAYRQCYIYQKAHIAFWKKRKKPWWYKK